MRVDAQQVSPSPTPPIPDDAMRWMRENGRRSMAGDPKGGGALVERYAGVTVYIYNSLSLSAYASLIPLRVHFLCPFLLLFASPPLFLCFSMPSAFVVCVPVVYHFRGDTRKMSPG